jgi:hypothetical protein
MLAVSLWAGVSTLGGCSSQQYDPEYWHKAFVAGLQNNVGKEFTRVRSTRLRAGETGGWAQEEDLVSHITLPSGHVAYRYRAGGTCRYTFEVDPTTGIIVAATWEGEAQHCIIIP